MHTLTNWKAKRAGGRMTVYGKDEAGNETKVVGVDYIERFEPERGAANVYGATTAITIAVKDHVSPSQWWRLAD